MPKALYRKYRSKKLSDIIGQNHITDILTRAIAQGRISHAYLLTGPRGVGKTSVARILAHEINGLEYDEDITHLDIIEIDAASNNGVEDVRDLREKVQIAPVSAKKKVYIIDEVHMLSKAAFNALLKTLEEPPEHVVFILATTNVEKLPATIISRTQRFSFRPISTEDAVSHLADIAQKEGIKISNSALELIAKRGDGSFRDSISLLDQLSSLTSDEITTELIENTLGLAPETAIEKLLVAVESHDLDSIVSTLDGIYGTGVNITMLVEQLTEMIKKQVISKPQFLPLLDALIDVFKSPQPKLKLLSVLGLAAAKRTPKTAALAAPVREVSESVVEIERQIAKDKALKQPAKSAEPKVEVNHEPSTIKAAPAKKATEVNTDNFDWSKFLSVAKQKHIALYSVLIKCGYELNGNVLDIYTGSKFYKNKLDDTKYCLLISECMQEIGVEGLDIHTISTTIPPKDDKAAAIAAIMGGGVEVQLESA